ncbi:MAG: hypothetical protein NTY02_19490 [Acidobacteria bacterium]|nr:hypothetical protein [Acidobacteriota bacterium]
MKNLTLFDIYNPAPVAPEDLPTAPWSGRHPETIATSRAAAESLRPDLTRLARVVVDAIGDGSTCDEVERRTALPHQTVSARIRELAQAGRIVATSVRRPTRSGRFAVVWARTGGPS